MRPILIAATLTTLTALSAFHSVGLAKPVCVVCAGPDQTYACELAGGDAANTAGAKLLCIQEIAERHGHQSCSVVAAANCAGVQEIVSDGDLAEVDAPAPLPVNAAEPASAAPLKPAQSFAGAATETIRKSSENVGNAIKGAGEAVGEAAKKTWDCVGSGFKECWK